MVGAGLSGAVIAERYATQRKQTVLVLEKRPHIAGNLYDYIDEETGIRVNQYGAHLFHTKYKRVWDYVQAFAEWIPYEHRVLTLVNGKHVPVPVNIDTVNALFGLDIRSEAEMDKWLREEQVAYPNPQNSEETALSRVGRRLYELLFKPYTIKQWAKTPSELGPEVLARIPVRNNHDPRYFGDPFQALPKDGYTAIFERMFDHPLIEVQTNINYFDVRDTLQCGRTYFTGPIDAYFAHLGWPKLEYRSLDFERKVVRDVDYYQPISVVNHPSPDVNYTRVVEYKHMLNQSSPHTVIFYERSKDGGEPYYPVPNPENKALYAKYQAMAAKEPNVTFVGRLANYKYFNMDQTVKNALELFVKDTVPSANVFPSLTPNITNLRQSIDERGCTPGSFDTTAQWRALFPNGRFPFKGKALVAIPIGFKGRATVDALVDSMGHDAFDYLFFAFDDTDWTVSKWYGRPGVEVKRGPGFKWTLYYDHLTSDVVAAYTHLFLWDDDLGPAPGFDGEALLHLVQSLDIACAQPMIRKNAPAHLEGISVQHRSSQLLHEVTVVEIMVPIYSTRLWVDCIRPRLVRERGTGFGIDTVLMQHGECVPDHLYTIRMPLDHGDGKSLAKKGAPESFELYQADVKRRGEPHRLRTAPFPSYDIHVDRQCRVRISASSRRTHSIPTPDIPSASSNAFWLAEQSPVLEWVGGICSANVNTQTTGESVMHKHLSLEGCKEKCAADHWCAILVYNKYQECYLKEGRVIRAEQDDLLHGTVSCYATWASHSLPQCEGWCDTHGSPWDIKCGWTSNACAACSQCTKMNEIDGATKTTTTDQPSTTAEAETA